MDWLLARQLHQTPAQRLDSFTVNRRTWHRLGADWCEAAEGRSALRVAQLVPFGRDNDYLEPAPTDRFRQRDLFLFRTSPPVNQDDQRCQIFTLAQIVE